MNSIENENISKGSSVIKILVNLHGYFSFLLRGTNKSVSSIENENISEGSSVIKILVNFSL